MTDQTTTADWPSVGVVVPTRDRPQLLRSALAAILGQDYPAPIHVIVVYDRSEPDHSLSRSDTVRRVTVTTNSRTPGLSGARNSATLELDTELVAFCDDDDEWLPGKLAAQVAALRARPAAEMAGCGILVDFQGRSTPRLLGADEVTHAELLRRRLPMLHSSTFLLRRDAVLDGLGLQDETIPGSRTEDWDLLLRATRRHPVLYVDRPLVRVLWGRTSFFDDQWEVNIASLRWMLEQHPDIAGDRVGAARVHGQIAFSLAAIGDRRAAMRSAWQAWRSDPREPRTYLSLAVAARAVSAERVLRTLHRFGRGV